MPIVSPNSRIRYPEQFVIGEGSIVDDFCYLSTQVTVGRYCHIASGCSISGGPDRAFTLGDYSGLASGARIYCASDDFIHGLVTIVPAAAAALKAGVSGDVSFGRYTGVGANCVVMPDNQVPEGTVIGALSFVPSRFRFEPWTVYVGDPIRRFSARDRDGVLGQVAAIERALERG
jgi:acetyltransferase-like isoleucine patch superfamily enzyme